MKHLLRAGVVESQDIVALAGSEETAVGRAACKVVMAARDKHREQIESAGRICDEDFAQDVRYRLGYIQACNDFLMLSEHATEKRKGGQE